MSKEKAVIRLFPMSRFGKPSLGKLNVLKPSELLAPASKDKPAAPRQIQPLPQLPRLPSAATRLHARLHVTRRPGVIDESDSVSNANARSDAD